MNKTVFCKPRGNQLAKVFRQLISKLGLSDKLLLTFAAAALTTVAIAAVGWLSFQDVVRTQRTITAGTIPAVVAVQDVARSNSRIISIAPQFGRIDNFREYSHLRKLLRDHVARMRQRLDFLEEKHFEPELQSVLADTVALIEAVINQQAVLVRDRLELEQREVNLIDSQRNAALKLVVLSESMVANASTSITSTISNLYPIIGHNEETDTDAYEALDRLIEIDVDNMERMSEFQLICFQLKALIEQLEDAARADIVSRIKSLFRSNLDVLELRIEDINDPQRRGNARNKHQLLASAMAPTGLFDTRIRRIALVDDIAGLQQLGNQHSSRLNEQANALLSAATDAIDHAGLEAEKTVARGLSRFLAVAALLLLTLVITLWVLMRHHIILRLHGMESAVKAISSGNLDIEISTSGSDELANLGKALERLRENARDRKRLEAELHNHQHNLERQVERRTAELKQSNTLLEKKSAEHALARGEAEQANQAKTTFLATMSHELRTPLSGVLGTLQILSETKLNERQREYIRMIRSANTTLLEILEDMLGYSKLESGKLDSERATFALRETVDNILSLQALRAQSKGVILIREISDTAPNRLLGDRPKLNQILLNLVGNAIKFTEEGSVTVSVVCSGRNRNEEEIPLIFTVTDTGIGIPDSKSEQVFDPFYQISDTAHRRHGGTGLGLTICKKLVEMLGGSIWIQSTPDRGTSVYFQLSFTHAPNELNTDVETTSAPAAHPDLPLTVLVVEDDDINRVVCNHYLESLGHKPLEAHDGVEALTLLQQQTDPVDIILMDIGLPGSSGVEVAVEIRALPDSRWEHVPIIAMSAHVFGDTVESYYASGMVGFLSKPFNKTQLNQALLSATTGQPADYKPASSEEIENSFSGMIRHTLLDCGYIDEELKALGHKLFKDLLLMFKQEVDEAFDSLYKHMEEKNWSALNRRAHRLKSAAGSLGMSTMTEQAEQIERAVSTSAADQNSITTQIRNLRKTCDNSCTELEEKLSEN